jgi:hypothetical protein
MVQADSKGGVMKAFVLVAVASGMALLGGCSGTTLEPGNGGQRNGGVLQLAGWPSPPPQYTTGGGVKWSKSPEPGDVTAPLVIEAPETVRVNAAFQVTVNTIGVNGCWRPDGQEVSISNRVVTLTPYDRVEGEVCTQALVVLPHHSTVTLNAAGTWTLRVTGRRTRIGSDVVDEPITAEKTIVAN